jgi:hypothetical protein
MAIIGKHLWDEESAIGTVGFTVPGGERWFISDLVIHCVAADTITVTTQRFSGSGAQIVFYAVLAAGDTAHIGPLVLGPGDALVVTATTVTSDITAFGGKENV